MKKFFAEFKEFISRGDVVSMAVGIIVGTLLSETFASIVPALILFAVSMFIVFIVLLVLRRCRRGRDEGCFER